MGVNPLNFALAQFSSVLRFGRGTFRRNLRRTADPAEPLVMYGFEGCPWCRLVRERLTELDLDYLHKSAPKGPSPKRDELKALAGKVQFPYLIDPNTDTAMFETADILAYLDATYG